MVKLCEPEVSEQYWLNCFTYKCNSCGKVFDIVFSEGCELVEFEEINGGDIKYLPMYGKGGYLDLSAKLLPGYIEKNDGNMEKSRLFLIELNKYCEKSSHGTDISFRKLIFECTNCKSKDITILKEDILHSPKLSWLKIDCSLMED